MARSVIPQQAQRSSDILRAAITVGLIAGSLVSFILFTHGRDAIHFTIALIIVVVATLAGAGLGATVGVVSSAMLGDSGTAEESSSERSH